jgi:hypothetical protein
MTGQDLKLETEDRETGSAVTANELCAEEPMKIHVGSLIHSDDKIKAITMVQLHPTWSLKTGSTKTCNFRQENYNPVGGMSR